MTSLQNRAASGMRAYGRALLPIACAILCCLVGTGCFGAKAGVPTRYYVLSPTVEVAKAEPVDLSLGVRPLLAARPYRLPMAYMQEGNLLQFRALDAWSEEPAVTLTRAIIDALARTGKYKDIGDAADMARPDLMLTGELRELHEDLTTTPSTAVAEIHLELRESRGNRLLWQGTPRASMPLADDTSAALADAMSKAVAQIVQEAVSAIIQA
jgi:ABC-type uncharacterized transport system auxiliary subunit